jgi:hypothetical protein
MREPHRSGVSTWAVLTVGQCVGFLIALASGSPIHNAWFATIAIQGVAIASGVIVWFLNKRELSNPDGNYIGRQP